MRWHSAKFATTVLIILTSLLSWQACAHLVKDLDNERWVEFNDNITIADSNNAIYFHQDPLSQLSLSYLKNNGILFEQYPKKVFNEGFTSSGYWLKMHLRSDTLEHNRWLMEIGYPLLDHLEVYIENEDGARLKQYLLGDLQSFTHRPIQHRNFVIPLDFSQHKIQTLYINVQTSSSMQLPVQFWQRDHFIEAHSTEQYGLGMYYGMMLVMFLYNLFLWLSFRDQSYLLYIAYIASFAALQLATSGIGYQFVWQDSTYFQQLAVPLTIALVGVFGTAFSRSFLHTQRYNRSADRALLSCLVLSAFTGVLAFVVDTSTVMAIAGPVVLAFLLVILYASTVTLLQGKREARFFLAAWVAFIIGGLVTISTIFGILPNNMLTIHASKIGSVFEIVLLSFALADRINLLQAEKKAAENQVKKELQRKTESLLESNRLKNDFLATISHEFRTPLNGILGSLELAKDGDKAELLSSIANARVSANEMLELVDNVLTYTELQAGSRIATPCNTELSSTLKNFADKIQPLCNAKGLGFELMISDDMPDNLLIDFKCLQHALKALIDNAIKFTNEGHIRLAVSWLNLHEESCIQFEIQDTGIGMSADEVQQVQGFMAQADSSHQRRYQGLGIGLSLVRAACLCLHGDIHISSEKDKGTNAQLRIPAKEPLDLNQSVHPLALHQDDSLSDQELRGHVLIVEDNTINQKVLRSMLGRMQLKVDIADNGEKALEKLQQTKDYHYDLIFMDCQMPVMDGFEATKRIRSSASVEATIPIIAVTANAMSGDEQQCLDAGMNDYLSKPINIEQVRHIVFKWLPAFNQAAASGQQ